jgi:hypothetical protein
MLADNIFIGKKICSKKAVYPKNIHIKREAMKGQKQHPLFSIGG